MTTGRLSSSECVVDMQLSGPVTQEADKLIEVLQLVKDCYPEQGEVATAEGEGESERPNRNTEGRL